MFNLQGSEIIIVLLLALVVLGPEKLPDAMRKAGKAYGELKKMSTGFQSEFRAAVDEPLREIRDTANVLRDSADFTKLQQGERAEKPKSAEMAGIGDDDGPTAEVPTFETPAADASGPTTSADSEAAPFASDSDSDGSVARGDDEPAAPVRPERAVVTAPAPFSAISSAGPRQRDAQPTAGTENDTATGEPVAKPAGPFSGVSSTAPRPREPEQPSVAPVADDAGPSVAEPPPADDPGSTDEVGSIEPTSLAGDGDR